MNLEEENDRRKQLHDIIKMYFEKNPEQFLHAKREVDKLTLEDKFQKGLLTLNDLDWLITNNLKRAETLGLRLSWKYTKEAVIGFIFDGDVQIFVMNYTSGFTHYKIAEMQFDFDYALTQWEKFDNNLGNGI